MIKSLACHNAKFHTFSLHVRWNIIIEEDYSIVGAVLRFFATEEPSLPEFKGKSS